MNEFIINTINKIFLSFSNTFIIQYAYEEISQTHFIILDSKEILESESFAQFDAEISLLFYKKRIDGSICFISKDSPYLFEKTEDYINPLLLEDVTEEIENTNFRLDTSFHGSLFQSFGENILTYTNERYHSDNDSFYPLAA